MIRKTKNIELFGEKLILSERTVRDVFVQHKLRSEGKGSFLAVQTVRDALKENLNRSGIIKKIRLRKKLKLKYLIKHLSVEQLKELYATVIEDLELNETSEKGNSGGVEISLTFQFILASKSLQIPINDVWDLPITVFREAVEYHFLWNSFLKGADVELVSAVDRRERLIKEYLRLFGE